ncbi:MAG: sigma-70 family RNA polymerase sigma factor [Cytophagales bacterium]|nr:MAG: sigma-70 family RNA polymerase sigma factor [Cytophagales bacterium]TAF60859.1 MAG: sigma-70 family RNA polymerase sigma factor [Cytophagales bacterium]
MEIEDDFEFDSKKSFSNKALKDFDLIDKAVQGDEKAFGELMVRYKNSVYFMLLKMVKNTDDAEDLTIEAFTKAFKSLKNFKKDYTFSTWLFRIATNNCIDFIRKKKIEILSIHGSYASDSGESVNLDVKDGNLDPQERTIKNQKIELVQEFVSLLPKKYRQLVELRYFEELSYEEIAERLDSPLGTVKAQLHRARELLLDIVKDKRDAI